jgi:hypothetical protein
MPSVAAASLDTLRYASEKGPPIIIESQGSARIVRPAVTLTVITIPDVKPGHNLFRPSEFYKTSPAQLFRCCCTRAYVGESNSEGLTHMVKGNLRSINAEMSVFGVSKN